jgi:PTH1 family peptidyl-tRNA hydrolase
LVLIIGLGNPGAAYENTRHNIGFMVIDRLAAAHAIKYSGKSGSPGRTYLWGRGTIERADAVLAKPLTYVNRSGAAVSELVNSLNITTHTLIVICDDCDLPFGSIRIRKKGGAGGHRGLESIIAHLGSLEFPRVLTRKMSLKICSKGVLHQ